MYLANCRLVVILGDILVDALSPQAAPYERVKRHDKALEMWRNSLPPDLRIDDSLSVARGLTISTPARVRCVTLQGIYLRMKMHHIRFVLHQQYASVTVCPVLSPQTCPETAKQDSARGGITECIEATVHSAGKVIDFLGEMIPMCSSNLFLALPGHVSWSESYTMISAFEARISRCFTGANSLFSAALFFAALLIARPETPSKEIFRQQVQMAMNCLGQLEHYVPHAGNGRVVLQALAPLFNDDLDDAARAEQIEALTSLTFPSHGGPLSSLRRLFVRQDISSVTSLSTRTRGRRADRGMDYTTSDGQVPGEIILHPTSPTISKTGQKTRTALEDEDDGGDSEYAESDTGDEESRNVSQGSGAPRSRPQMPVLASSEPSATTTPISAMTSQELSHVSPTPTARLQPSSTLSGPEHQIRQSHQLGLQTDGFDIPLPPRYSLPTSANGIQMNGAVPHPSTAIRPHTSTSPSTPGSHHSSAIVPQVAEADRVTQGYRPVAQRLLHHPQHSAPQFQANPPQRVTNLEYDDQTRAYGPPQMNQPSANFAYHPETVYRASPPLGFDQSMQHPIVSPHPYAHPHASYSNRTQYGPPPGALQQQQRPPQPTITGLTYQNQSPQGTMSRYTVAAEQMHVGYRDIGRTSDYPSRQQNQNPQQHDGQFPHQSPPPNQETSSWASGSHEFWA